jgi:hypothetical protein
MILEAATTVSLPRLLPRTRHGGFSRLPPPDTSVVPLAQSSSTKTHEAARAAVARNRCVLLAEEIFHRRDDADFLLQLALLRHCG